MQKVVNVYLHKQVNGFDKTRRLLKKSDYDSVFNQAKKCVNSDFIVLYRDNSVGQARLGLALSKKVIAKAHDRNRIKRIIREAFRTRQLPPVDVIFLARQGVSKASNSLIYAKLNSVWDKLCEK